MTAWEAIVLGFVQGATEFLPVSSSGHLVIGQTLLRIRLPGVSFEVAVHVATLVSVLVVYRQRVADLLVGAVGRRPDAWRYLALLLLATVPAAAAGLLLGDRIEALFDSPSVVGVALLVTGTFLWTSRGPLRRPQGTAPGVREAVVMGIAQAVALVPGISRSGATVVAGLWLGLDAREAAAFSFLMAIPAIAGAAVLQAGELSQGPAGLSAAALGWGALAAGVTGVLAIRMFVALLRAGSFHRFALYCWTVGALFLAYLWVW